MNKPTGENANIVIFCSDPRVVKWLHDVKIRQELDIGESFSAIAETGSIKFFLYESLMDKLFLQLEILVEHFQPQKIILLSHSDCGYYKSIDQNKEEIYIEDLKNVKEEISQKYSQVKVEGYLLDTEIGELKLV